MSIGTNFWIFSEGTLPYWTVTVYETALVLGRYVGEQCRILSKTYLFVRFNLVRFQTPAQIVEITYVRR